MADGDKTAKERVMDEQAEIQIRINNLDVFIKHTALTLVFEKKLTEEGFYLLLNQRSAMGLYNDILRRRIDVWVD